VDIDGVLCRDPTEEENDDGPKYTEFISQVQPLIVPSVEMGHLVTCRLEKYRGPTEQWLARHGFQYGKLVMMDLPDKAARLSADNHADFKAAFYHQCNSCLFIESSLWQARTIVGRTGKSVFCAETREMLAPGVTSKSRRLALKIVPYLWRRIKSAAGQR
jgi:orotate phosphoribosyltransferase